jgi:hypothetical protein
MSQINGLSQIIGPVIDVYFAYRDKTGEVRLRIYDA